MVCVVVLMSVPKEDDVPFSSEVINDSMVSWGYSMFEDIHYVVSALWFSYFA